MKDVYEEVPVLQNDRFLLRAADKKKDAPDLLKVYSDIKAAELFNSDNCEGDDFYYTTLERMCQALDFWDFSYKNRYFVRWSVIEKKNNTAIGTIELFNRQSQDYFDNCGILRLDLRSDYETSENCLSIIDLITPKAKDLFSCDMIATKAIPAAKQRIAALISCGFHLSDEKLCGNDMTLYDSYYVKELL
ncbi:MAG: N-acetyltransferase [Oscillospiraceae bacterium]|nr:N-acetyltransferase [Oscillospiraceae bacterium]